MHLFTALPENASLMALDLCRDEEGILEWVPVSDIEKLPIWEGDRIFLHLLAADSPFFSLKLEYQGDKLINHILY